MRTSHLTLGQQFNSFMPPHPVSRSDSSYHSYCLYQQTRPPAHRSMTTQTNESSKLVPSAPEQPNPDIIVSSDSVVAVPIDQPDTSKPCSVSVKGNSFGITLCGDYVSKSSGAMMAKRNSYICLCGNHTFDLRQAQFPTHESISINIFKLCGDLQLIVPPNVSVSCCAAMLCGDRRIETAAPVDGTGPHIELHLVKLCGDVIVTNEEQD